MRHATRTVRAFTMLEMMLVLVIIGILMGVAVFAFQGYVSAARIQQTKARLKQIGGAIATYNGANAVNPPDLLTLTQGATALLVRSALKDAWKEDWVYYPVSAGMDPARGFDLYSKGPDKIPNTEDDIDYWVLQESD